MSCHICGQEAVDRCYTCGQLFCEKHGQVNCSRCETGIAPGDNRADRVSAGRLRDEPEGRKAWWRAQPAEDYELPSCHICQGLARRVCRNCELHYCAEHAGPSQLCQTCGRSSLMGIWCLLGGMAILWGILLLGTIVDTLGQATTVLIGKILVLTLLSLGGYLLMSFSCRGVFRKAGKPGWIGFIPIWNLALLLELGGKRWWWILLYVGVVPFVGSGILFLAVLFGLGLAPSLVLASSPAIVLQILLGLGLAQNFGKSQEFGFGLGILPIVFLPMLAFGDAAYVPVAENDLTLTKSRR
jgi:hypothetical protein